MSKIPRWGKIVIAAVVVGLASLGGFYLVISGDFEPSVAGLLLAAVLPSVAVACALTVMVTLMNRAFVWDDARRKRRAAEIRAGETWAQDHQKPSRDEG